MTLNALLLEARALTRDGVAPSALVNRLQQQLEQVELPVSGQTVMTLALLFAARGELVDARRLFESVAWLPGDGDLARGWLAADAAAVGDWDRVRRFASAASLEGRFFLALASKTQVSEVDRLRLPSEALVFLDRQVPFTGRPSAAAAPWAPRLPAGWVHGFVAGGREPGLMPVADPVRGGAGATGAGPAGAGTTGAGTTGTGTTGAGTTGAGTTGAGTTGTGTTGTGTTGGGGAGTAAGTGGAGTGGAGTGGAGTGGAGTGGAGTGGAGTDGAGTTGAGTTGAGTTGAGTAGAGTAGAGTTGAGTTGAGTTGAGTTGAGATTASATDSVAPPPEGTFAAVLSALLSLSPATVAATARSASALLSAPWLRAHLFARATLLGAGDPDLALSALRELFREQLGDALDLAGDAAPQLLRDAASERREALLQTLDARLEALTRRCEADEAPPMPVVWAEFVDLVFETRLAMKLGDADARIVPHNLVLRRLRYLGAWLRVTRDEQAFAKAVFGQLEQLARDAGDDAAATLAATAATWCRA